MIVTLPGLPSLRDGDSWVVGIPVVSLRSTTGYKLTSLRDSRNNPSIPTRIFTDATGISSGSRATGMRLRNLPNTTSDAGGIPAGSRWLSEATPPGSGPQHTAPRQGASRRPMQEQLKNNGGK
ncbi:MAG: hypothetical protein QM680_02010 [Luteolibacter sp.]